MNKRNPLKNVLLCCMLLSAVTATAQTALTLDQCRQRALAANKGLLIANEKVVQSEATRRAAIDQFLPKVSANGLLLASQEPISLLSDAQQQSLNTIGDAIVGQMRTDLGNGFIANFLSNTEAAHELANRGNQVGQTITNSLETDTRTICAGAVSVSQPLYMGGKIRALYQIANANAQVQNLKYGKAQQDLILQVDEAYWRVVSVDSKLQLAQDYYNLLDTLSTNVSEMMAVGLATQGDLLKVQVKRNEALMSLSRAQNGAVLSRMALAQLCGISLDSTFTLADNDPKAYSVVRADTAIDMQQVLANRTEMKMLDQAQKVALAEKKVAVSTLLPNVVANGGYLVSNPNILNGFDKSFGGMFYGGVVLNIPLAHPASIHAVQVAKSKEREAALQQAEAEEMIRLQVTQTDQKSKEAQVRLNQASSSIGLAEETLRLAKESFAAGIISASDLLGANTAWMQAKSELIDAEIDVRICNLYLNQVLGK